MNRKNIVILGLLLGAVLNACHDPQKNDPVKVETSSQDIKPAEPCAPVQVAVSTTQPSSTQPASSSPLATFNGRPITEEEVRVIANSEIIKAERDLYDAKRDAIDQIINQNLMEEAAKKQKMSFTDFYTKSVNDKVKVSADEVKKFYTENPKMMRGESFDKMQPQIEGYLKQQKQQKIAQELRSSLRKKASIQYFIDAPKMDIEEGDSPSIGPKDAKVKIVEFTDYQCPFCGKARDTVNQILSTYKGKVRYTLRDFPLNFHPDSLKAHEGARCAGDQGKYWEFNHLLFGNQDKIKIDDLKKYAEDLKLNKEKFNQCLDSGTYTEKVKASQAYGQSVGVSGTPAFFINGRMISGAQPFPAFSEIIDTELSR